MLGTALPWAQCGRRGLRRACALVLTACWLGVATLAPAPAAGQSSEQLIPRKVLYKQNPNYPVALREARIGGIVRLEIAISPRGSVESVLPLGGNPVLVEAAAAAVKKWKYAPADSETKTQLVFTFDPRR